MRGRKRRACRRQPNGQPARRAAEQQAIPPEALEQRVRLVGERNASQPEAGYALGVLLLRGLIDQRKHDAGMAFRQSWLRWASMAALPPHEVVQRQGGTRAEVDRATWLRVRAAYRAAAAVVRGCHPSGLVWAAVESIVMDNVLPPLLHERGAAVSALRTGLEALAGHYRIPGGAP